METSNPTPGVAAALPSFGIAWPAAVDFAAGAADGLGATIRAVGGTRVLLVTDRGLAATPVVPRLVAGLREAGLEVAVFDGIQPNPVIAGVREAHGAWQALGADTLLAVGGGSVIDSSKVLAVRIASDADEDTVLREADAVLVRTPPRFIVVPTTAGTGSESTTAALVKGSDGIKRLMRSLRARPQRIVLDPALTLSVPRGMTAATGFDVLMHAVGALGTSLRNPVGEALAREALARALPALPRAVEHGDSLPARGDMLYASYLAGLAIMMNGCDAIHGLCTPLESAVDRPHGLVLSATFPTVMRFNLAALAPRYALAARQCGLADAGMPDLAAARALLDALLAVRRRIGLDVTLRGLGIEASMLDALPERALASRATQINEVALSRDDIVGLYRAMWAEEENA